eukprot:GHVS01060649.1.p1 GENE.GHVS01060649.1~~GHVS01060649.1.p1  ORF type:complete len:994 (-),score=173.55 GHVS01060649.1:179-3160(-)
MRYGNSCFSKCTCPRTCTLFAFGDCGASSSHWLRCLHGRPLRLPLLSTRCRNGNGFFFCLCSVCGVAVSAVNSSTTSFLLRVWGIYARRGTCSDKKKKGEEANHGESQEHAENWSRASSHAATAGGHSHQSHRARTSVAGQKRVARAFSPFSSSFSFSSFSCPADLRCGGVSLSRLEACIPCSISLDGVSSVWSGFRGFGPIYVLTDTQVMHLSGSRIDHAYDWYYHRLLLLSNRSSLSRFNKHQTQPPAGIEWAAASRAVVDPMASFSLMLAEEEEQKEAGCTERGKRGEVGNTSSETGVYAHKSRNRRWSIATDGYPHHVDNPTTTPATGDYTSDGGLAVPKLRIDRHSVATGGDFCVASSCSPSTATPAWMGGASVSSCPPHRTGGAVGYGNVVSAVGGSARAVFSSAGISGGNGVTRFPADNSSNIISNISTSGAATDSSTLLAPSSCSTELPSLSSSLGLYGLSPTSSLGVSPPHSPPLPPPPASYHSPPPASVTSSFGFTHSPRPCVPASARLLSPHALTATGHTQRRHSLVTGGMGGGEEGLEGLSRRRPGVERLGSEKEGTGEEDGEGADLGGARQRGGGRGKRGEGGGLPGWISSLWSGGCSLCKKRQHNGGEGADRNNEDGEAAMRSSVSDAFFFGVGQRGEESRRHYQRIMETGETKGSEGRKSVGRGEPDGYRHCVVGRLSKRLGLCGELVYDCVVVNYQLIVPFSSVFILGFLLVLTVGLLPYSGVGDVGMFTALTNMKMGKGGEGSYLGVGNHLLANRLPISGRSAGGETDEESMIRIVYTEVPTLQQYQVDISRYYSERTLKLFGEAGIDPSIIETKFGHDSQHLYSHWSSLLSPASSPPFRRFSLTPAEFRRAVSSARSSLEGRQASTIIEVQTGRSSSEDHLPEYKSILYKIVGDGQTVQLFHDGADDGHGNVVWNPMSQEDPYHHLRELLSPEHMKEMQQEEQMSAFNWRSWMRRAQQRMVRKTPVDGGDSVCRA